ncbi:uncharacterized protein LOC124651835 [Lolium rigidum]|uniref:uncharacterized protein LOC124651835 n=1 Tax=Lolium rigidum TaxID=89674 RepID=UPI001F5DC821|nr:uncharacterized protein LOC124651835 [Lolium rigidum]
MAAGGVELVKKNTMVIFCALAVVVALLMATQAAATAGNQGAARRLLYIFKCQYPKCNCNTCSIYNWACCSTCC